MKANLAYDSKFLVAALLLTVAKGDGEISDAETGRMLELVQDRFRLRQAESLEILREALSSLADEPNPNALLHDLGAPLSAEKKEDVAFMMLEVIAADGHQEVDELDQMNSAAEIIEIPPEIMHRAYTRYFEEHRI